MTQPCLKSFFLCLFTMAVALPSAVRAEDPPNIVFFFTDDQTTSTIGCYGNPIVQTPNIDALAERGTRFENAFVSHSICWVSRTTILSGLTGRTYGTPGNHEQARPEAVETLYSDILRANGYRTGYFGKWHAKMPKGYKQEDHFDEFEAIGRNPFYKKQPDGSLRHATELIVDRGIDFLKRHPKDKPFALNMWFNACHAEDGDRRPGIGHFAWPRAMDGMYDDTEMYQPKLNDPAIFDALPGFLKTTINRERYFWRWNTEEKYQENMKAYFRMVSGIDNAIGRFEKALEEAGLADNTIIVYSADNGYHMGNRGLAGKWSHFEESLRVPLIVADPRVPEEKQGQVTDAIALNLDLPATFLDWAGAEVPERYQGHSLKPIVSDGNQDGWRTESFHEHFAVRSRIPAFEGIRNKDFKYVRYIDHGKHEFLHDLKNDPDELVNLADDPKFKKTLQEMRARTDKRVDELGGPLGPPTKPFTSSTVPHPEASAAVTVKPGKDGFVRLFNGNRLNGWVGDTKYWSVKDGVLTGVTDGSLKMNRFITWKGSTIQNFDLRVKVKVSKGGNSGIQYRGKSAPELGLDIVTGYQCDVVADIPKYNGMLYEEKGRRILSHTGEKVVVDPDGQPWVVGEMPVKEFAPGEWHDYRVLVRGNHHQHWINGHPTADLIDLDENGRALEGVLAVQVHVGPAMEIQYKDFMIKHLPDDLPLKTAKDVTIPADAYGVRPQGKLPKDWKAPVYGKQKSAKAANAKAKVKPQAPAPTKANVAYGPYPENVLDFWKAEGDGPRPLHVYIHGGGWRGGTKAVKPGQMEPFLEKGVSCISVEYRLTPDNPLPAPVHDAARAIQFIRTKAKEWNIDPDKIVLTGGSAGACTSMWLLMHDDLADPDAEDPVLRESTRVTAAAVSGGQTSIDPKQIVPWLGEKVLDHLMIANAVGEPGAEAALANYEKHEAHYKEFSAYNHVSKGDPPLYMRYGNDMTLPSKNAGHGIHHPVYGVKMKEKCDEMGVECHLQISGVSEVEGYSSSNDFLLKKLGVLADR